MKILFVITGLKMGGAERQLSDLADCLVKFGHTVKIVSLTAKAETGVLPKHKNIETVYLNMNKNPFSFITTYLKLSTIIREFRPDVVHSHMVHANIMARLVRISTHMPKLVCTAHSKNEGGQLRMWAYRLTNKLADVNTNVSQEAVDEFVKKGAVKFGQMIAMPNGIDVEHFVKNETSNASLKKELGIEASDYLFVAVGRLEEAKDYPNLLNAFALVKKQKPQARLLIVGVGSLEQSLKSLVRDLNLEDSITFLGLRNDIAQLMNLADSYVMSSFYEGFGIVLAESMACENITISTDCGGTKDVIGEYGFLVPIRDSQALAAKMLESMNLSPEQRAILGKNAREHIKKHYSLDAITKKWLELYQK